MKKKDNQGFTLIELIVVIAIMGVALGIMSYSLSLIQSTRAKTCASSIENALTTQRTTAMAKGNTESTVYIYKDSTTGKVMLKKGSADAEEVGGSSLTITYHFKGESESTYETLGSETSGKELKINFSSSTGGITDTGAIDWIRISGNHNYKITIYKLTGKAEMERE